MNRKKTILIAIFINAALIAILLVAALTTPEEIAPSSPVMALKSELNLPEIVQNPPALPTLPLEPAVSVIEEPIVYQLPPPVTEEPSPPTDLKSLKRTEVVVKKGDTLEKIAKAHHTTVDEIIKTNHLPSSFLKVGQVLQLPTEKPIAKGIEKPISRTEPEYYIMKVGENPWAIAMKHRMKVEELLKLNGLNEEKARRLKPGDRLRIR